MLEKVHNQHKGEEKLQGGRKERGGKKWGAYSNTTDRAVQKFVKKKKKEQKAQKIIRLFL